MEEQKKEEIKKSTYTDAQKRATKKYRENNKEKVNLQRKLYYQNRKNKDPNFLLYKRQKAKEYYTKKKQMKEVDKKLKETPQELLDMAIDKTELNKIIEQVLEENKENIEPKQELPIQPPTTPEKKKRVYKKKKTE
jgi:G:T/U-mismatch repair DNA glycosylase